MARESHLVPRSVLSPPEAARRRVALVVAAAMGSAALAGVWLRMDDSLLLRLVLATTTAIFSWLVIDVALSASDAAGAVGRAIGLSIVTGTVNTVIPSIIVTSGDRMPFVFCLIAGGFFGAFVGLAYGLVLGIVAGLTWRQVASGTHDGADRAVRRAAAWTIAPLGFIAWTVFGHDMGRELSEWASDHDRAAHVVAFPLGVLALGIAFWVALLSFKIAHDRLGRRRKWLALVTSGLDPRWGVREIGPHDDIGNVPRLREGFSVLEHKNEHAVYRATATGEAVALI
jgi:hypothetical protein